MRIEPISTASPTLPGSPAQGTASQGVASFSGTLKDAIAEVNRLQQEGDRQAEMLASGQTQDLHQVMLSLEEARMAVQLLVQTRNKVLEAYQEIMRIQI